MDYFGELVWRKENKEYLIISMRKLINLHLKFNYMHDMKFLLKFSFTDLPRVVSFFSTLSQSLPLAQVRYLLSRNKN